MSDNEEPITYMLDFTFDYKIKIGGCKQETIEKRGAKGALRQRCKKHYGSNPNLRVIKATRKFLRIIFKIYSNYIDFGQSPLVNPIMT